MKQTAKERILRSFVGLFITMVLISPTRTADADVRTEARRHFRAGMALIASGEVDEGVSELQEAYEILPHPNVLYNIGRAYAESGRYMEALDFFQQYLDSDPPDRTEVLGFVAALQQRIATVNRETTEPAPTVEPETETGLATGTPVATDEELQTLEQAATQVQALAESAQSDVLRQRAERLRGLADALRRRRVGPARTTSVTNDTGSDTETGLVDSTEDTQVANGEPTGETSSGVDETNELQLGEQREGDTYEETVVSSSRRAQSPLEAPNSLTIVTAQDLRLSGLTNPAEALRRVAGVELMSNSPGDTQISIRGLNQRISNRTIVLLDGRSLYLDFLGATVWGLLPLALEDIERVEVVRGPASALYGADAFTGVINIISRPIGEGRSYISSGFGSHGQFRVAGTVTERVDRLRFRLSGGFSRADSFARLVGPNRQDFMPYPQDPGLGFRQLFFRGDMQFRVADGYSIAAGTGISSLDTSFQALGRLREMYMNDALFAQTYAQINTEFGLSARAFWNRFQTRHGVNEQTANPLSRGDVGQVNRQDVIDVELVYQNEFTINSVTNQLIGGAGYRFKELDWDWLIDPEINNQQTRTQNHFNVFLQDTLRIDDVVQIVASARLDQHPLLSEPQVSPRGSILVHPTERQTIRFTGGTAFRSPTFTESYVSVPNSTPVRGITAFGVGNQSLNPERIVSTEVGYMLQEFDYFALELNGYFNLVYDQILLLQNTAYRLFDTLNDPRAAFNSAESAFPLSELQFQNEAATFFQYGGELVLRVYPVDGLDIYANYAIHWTTPEDASALGERAEDARTSAHKVNAGIQYRSSFGLDLSVDFSWVSEQNWVEQVLDAERGGTAFVPFSLPSYTIVNARVGYRLLDDALEFAVVGSNLVHDGHREHPYGQPISTRVMGHVTYRF